MTNTTGEVEVHMELVTNSVIKGLMFQIWLANVESPAFTQVDGVQEIQELNCRTETAATEEVKVARLEVRGSIHTSKVAVPAAASAAVN